ncbi:MAG: hypothetical protein JWM46_232 [Candidatus Kaiserbacteria bacterium]|nr:hypothetical protein [Candidatus Kaiserbacteria bacterium]
MKINIHIIAAACVLIACFAWYGIWYIGNDLLDQALARASTASSAQAQSDRVAYTKRIGALVADTTNDRAALEGASGMSIVSIATLIESVGTKTGIVVKVDSAQSQGSSAAAGTLNDFAVVAEADGSFAQIIRTLQELESLPLPSTVDQIEIMQNGGAGGADHGWHLNIRLSAFTSASS